MLTYYDCYCHYGTWDPVVLLPPDDPGMPGAKTLTSQHQPGTRSTARTT